MFTSSPTTTLLRSPHPRFPSFRKTALISVVTLSLLSLLPQQVISAPSSAPGLFGDLGAPLARVAALRLPTLSGPVDAYQPLPRRSAELNAMLERSVEALTHGEALSSRTRILALQDDIKSLQREMTGKRYEMIAASGCVPSYSSLREAVNSISCELAPSPSSLNEDIRDLEGTLRQRQMQIAAERNRFASELQSIGLPAKPEQVDGLLHLASANDLISLKSAYTNLSDLTEMVRASAARADASPSQLRRYYGLYTVLLEVAMHMHEDTYFKLQTEYLPRLDAITDETIATFRQAEQLRAKASSPDYVAQLEQNMRSLTTTMKAATLYRETLTAQAKAVNTAWLALKERHDVAANVWRTSTVSSDLLEQMEHAGRSIEQLNSIETPALQRISSPAVQREFDRLTTALIIPNS